MRALLGAALLAATIGLIVLLRPRDGKERLPVRFPGAWIVVGLLLTISVSAGIALIVTGAY